jgi:hypothetical protein
MIIVGDIRCKGYVADSRTFLATIATESTTLSERRRPDKSRNWLNLWIGAGDFERHTLCAQAAKWRATSLDWRRLFALSRDLKLAIEDRLQYRRVSAAGTVAAPLVRPIKCADGPRNLAIPPTTGMPHRPASSDGQSSVFVSSNPIGLRYHLPKIARRYARLRLAIGAFGSAAVPTVSHRRRTVRHGPYWTKKRVAITEPLRHANSPQPDCRIYGCRSRPVSCGVAPPWQHRWLHGTC